jgi:hypothetical protein
MRRAQPPALIGTNVHGRAKVLLVTDATELRARKHLGVKFFALLLPSSATGAVIDTVAAAAHWA